MCCSCNDDSANSTGTCAFCGNVFSKSGRGRSHQVYCSRSCREKDMRRNSEHSSNLCEKTCPVCGKTFVCTSHRQRFCSEACFVSDKKAKRRQAVLKKYGIADTAKCPICGKEFRSRITRGKPQRCCSDACSKKYYKMSVRSGTHERVRASAKPRHCAFCGKEFSPDVNHSFAKYCSPQCMNLRYRYKTMENYKAHLAERTNKVQRRETQRDAYGCTAEERRAVIAAQSGPRDDLWKASQAWTPGQHKFAKARWNQLHPMTQTFFGG